MKKLAFLLALFMILSAVSCTDPAPLEDEESASESAEEQTETASDETDTNAEDTADTDFTPDSSSPLFVNGSDADKNDGLDIVYADFAESGIFELGVAEKYTFDGKEYVSLNYYAYTKTSPEVMDTVIETDKLICTFETQTDVEGVVWEVYTVKGAEWRNSLYIESGTGSAWFLYEMPVAVPEKPVIYLYPETPTDVTVRLDYVGELTHTYPKYDGGWRVTAYPDGTLVDADGREYYCLFWEGRDHVSYDMSEGFCVAGDETEEFLEDALAKLGLNAREANEFIIYWLPQMENNAYNLISFQTDTYTDAARLFVDPAPDTLIRVFMTWKALDAPADVAPQTLTAPEREGFVLVEWGATELD